MGKRKGKAKETDFISQRKRIIDASRIVYQMILDCFKTHEIHQAINQKYGLSSRQTDRYIAHCYKLIDRKALEDVEKWRKLKKRQLDDLYNEARLNHDLQECRQIINIENKVFGYEQIKIDHNVNGELLQKIKELFF